MPTAPWARSWVLGTREAALARPAKAIELANAGEPGAVAALVALLMGMRANEIVSRVVRDLDDEGRLLWIPDSTTEAGRRTLQVPDLLRAHLRGLAEGKRPEAALFGHHWRDWVRKWVLRICVTSGVPSVTAHAMRGLHSTLARAWGLGSRRGVVTRARVDFDDAVELREAGSGGGGEAAPRSHRAERRGNRLLNRLLT